MSNTECRFITFRYEEKETGKNENCKTSVAKIREWCDVSL